MKCTLLSYFEAKQLKVSDFSKTTSVRLSFWSKIMFQSEKLCLPGLRRPEKGFGVSEDPPNVTVRAAREHQNKSLLCCFRS